MLKESMIAATPEEVGVDRERLEAVFARAKRDIDDRTLPNAQVAVARNGKVAGIRTFGTYTAGGSEQPATDATLFCIFSCTKVMVAAAVWLLLEEGKLSLDERVADIIPEFGTNGKDTVTVEQVLLHTGGFPFAPFAASGWADRDARLEAFSRWRLNWDPDTSWEYHATSAHWVLAELIVRRGGKDYRDFIRQRITGPMGLDELFVGLPPEYNSRVADVSWVSEPVEPPTGWGEVTPEAILSFNQEASRPAGLPGGGGVASAGELAMFYQVLLAGGRAPDGTQVLKPETVEFATTVRTEPRHVDRLWKKPVNRGLSIIIAGDDGDAFMRGFGRCASGRAFGHGGAGGQMAWGDPETGISLGYCTSGFVDYMAVGRRVTAISSLAAQCAAD